MHGSRMAVKWPDMLGPILETFAGRWMLYNQTCRIRWCSSFWGELGMPIPGTVSIRWLEALTSFDLWCVTRYGWKSPREQGSFWVGQVACPRTIPRAMRHKHAKWSCVVVMTFRDWGDAGEYDKTCNCSWTQAVQQHQLRMMDGKRTQKTEAASTRSRQSINAVCRLPLEAACCTTRS